MRITNTARSGGGGSLCLVVACVIMSQFQLEKDVANYVLAYLARQSYKNTMSAFLQECSFLPPNTTGEGVTNSPYKVLPETPLSAIVADYKTRQQSTLLLEQLGPKASWDALWEKLQHYLSQLRTLADTLLCPRDQPSTNRYAGRKRPCRTRASQLHQFPVPLDPAFSSVATTSQPAGSEEQTTSATQVSPRKSKKPVQFHMQTLSEVQVTPPDPSLAPRQLLDILLEDESLQHHLADLINSSLLGDGGPEVADHALDEILALAAPDTMPDHSTEGNQD